MYITISDNGTVEQMSEISDDDILYLIEYCYIITVIRLRDSMITYANIDNGTVNWETPKRI